MKGEKDHYRKGQIQGMIWRKVGDREVEFSLMF